MNQLIEKYNRDGYVHIEGYVPQSTIEMISPFAMGIRLLAHEYSDWKGVPCAGRHSIMLNDFYESDLMVNLAQSFLGDDCYFFNDQVVYKLPNETTFVFEAHYDNQYGPNMDNKIHTVNCCVILDDFEVPLDVKSPEGWVSLYPKKGDIVAIRGDTYHRSAGNTSDKPRGLYACVYTKEPLHLEGFYNKHITNRSKKD
jgi:hypothetical protein